MPQHAQPALEFLDAFTAYFTWRKNNRVPPGFDVSVHVKRFARYIEHIGIAEGTPLHEDLVKYMEGFDEAGNTPRERLPRDRRT